MLAQDSPTTALLLTGGGARAAYQVGVLLAIAQLFERRAHSPFHILCGSSAGAINATALACDSGCFHLGVKRLDSVWRNFATHQVYRCDWRGVGAHMLRQFVSRLRADYGYQQPVSLLDNHPLQQLLSRLIDFRRIDRNIQRGLLRAVAVTASSYSSGQSLTFFQGMSELQPWQRAKRQGRRTLLSTSHLLASSAIPFVFPSVRIHQDYYGDGSIHQLAPLSPAIHLGAERILIVGVDQPASRPLAGLAHHPSSAAIAGHLLDTIFADTLRSDLERLERVNRTVSFLPAELAQHNGLRRIDTLLINPSASFSQLAQRHYRALPRALRSLLSAAGVNEGGESSLLSYLLFERPYTQALIQLGVDDANARRHELQTFFNLA